MAISKELLGTLLQSLGSASADVHNILLKDIDDRKSLARELDRALQKKQDDEDKYKQDKADKLKAFERDRMISMMDDEAKQREREKKDQDKRAQSDADKLNDPDYRYNRYFLRGEEPPAGFSDRERAVFEARFNKDIGANQKRPTSTRDYVADSAAGFAKVQSTRENIGEANSKHYHGEPDLADPYAHMPKLGSSLDYYNAVVRQKVLADRYFQDPARAADSIATLLGQQPAPPQAQMGEEMYGPPAPSNGAPEEIDITPQVEAIKWQSLPPASKVDMAKSALSQTDDWGRLSPREQEFWIQNYIANKDSRSQSRSQFPHGMMKVSQQSIRPLGYGKSSNNGESR